jgi:predicted glycosyltransferase
MDINVDDKFILMRFVAWKAGHDITQKGFDLETKLRYVKSLEKYAKVYISSETELPPEFEEYRITIPPEKIHDFMYYAQLLVGDSQTMTTEAALLGTPAVRCNSFVGENDMANFIELENKYDLIYSFSDYEKALDKAISLLQKSDLKEQWAQKREVMLSDKVDVSSFIVDYIDKYSKSN